MKIDISKSDRSDKKLKAVFTDNNNKTKTTHFGLKGSTTYLDTGDKELRKNYRARHQKDLKTNDPTRAGYLSYYLLWGDSTSLNENLKDYKKRFNLK